MNGIIRVRNPARQEVHIRYPLTVALVLTNYALVVIDEGKAFCVRRETHEDIRLSRVPTSTQPLPFFFTAVGVIGTIDLHGYVLAVMLVIVPAVLQFRPRRELHISGSTRLNF